MLRFNQFFVGLLILAFLGAFVLPQRPSDRAKGQIQNLFLPVAWPVRKIAAAIHGRVTSPQIIDEGSRGQARSYAEITEENHALRLIIESLHGQLEQMLARSAEREALGELGQFCRPFGVKGADPSPQRDALLLDGTSFAGIANDQPVLATGGDLIGRISQAGVGGAKVLLLTDKSVQFTGRFVRMAVTADKRVELKELITQPMLVRGAGKGKLIAPAVQRKLADPVKLAPGDLLEPSDSPGEWPTLLKGCRIAVVTEVKASRDPGFVDVYLAPPTNLTTLREVMVMTKMP